jgi:hypothetical protein
MVQARETRLRIERLSREQAFLEIWRRKEAMAEAQRLASVQAELAFREEQMAAATKLAALAAGAGLIVSVDAFFDLPQQHCSQIAEMSRVADLLHDDLQQAMRDNLLAEKGVAYGRPIASGASFASFLNGHPVAGIALAALAIGARSMSDDWKRMKLTEFQTKWANIFSSMSADEAVIFTRIFSHKYPYLAANAAGAFGFLPS